MAKRLFLLLLPLALVLGVVSRALLLGAKTGTSKGNYRIASAALGLVRRQGAMASKPLDRLPGYVTMLGKIAGCW